MNIAKGERCIWFASRKKSFRFVLIDIFDFVLPAAMRHASYHNIYVFTLSDVWCVCDSVFAFDALLYFYYNIKDDRFLPLIRLPVVNE